MATRNRRRRWMVTLNNPTDEEKEEIKKSVDHDVLRYIVGQEEQGEQGTPHLQLYVEFTKAVRMGQVKRILGCRRIHAEAARGKQAQCIAYVTKTDTRVMNGFSIRDGVRARGADGTAGEMVLAGHSSKEILESCPDAFIRHATGIVKAVSMMQDDRNHRPEIYIFFGRTGTGKTYSARTRYPDAYFWTVPAKAPFWFFNYSGEETIVIDEFVCQFPAVFANQLFDYGPMNVQIKGGYVKLQAWRWIITTNVHPDQWYLQTPAGIRGAFFRRLRQFTNAGANVREFTREIPGGEDPPAPEDRQLPCHMLGTATNFRAVPRAGPGPQ